jgi:NTP pyrophosphatase (non-canonical NTP hydrolase)
MRQAHDERGDMTFRDAAKWANQQAKKLATHFGLDVASDRNMFALAQAAKLGEEVGELHSEVLGAIGYCSADKAAQFSRGSLAGELADVAVCTLLLAEIFEIDLSTAVADKIAALQERQF